MKTTGAALILTLLERQGIETVAGIPGGANLPLYDALNASPIRHVLARHEQGAGFIAQGMARVSGAPAASARRRRAWTWRPPGPSAWRCRKRR